VEYLTFCQLTKVSEKENLHRLCSYNSLKFFGKGAGKPFSKKRFSHINKSY